MALDVAAARAAVSEAAHARDRARLVAVSDSLPVLNAFAYERHRARAYACALRGARDSAFAELCLGVAASAPTAATFAEDANVLRVLLGDIPLPPETDDPRGNLRVLASGAALVLAVAALAALPAIVLDNDGPAAAAGITVPDAGSAPDVVVQRVLPQEPLRRRPARARETVVPVRATVAPVRATRPAARPEPVTAPAAVRRPQRPAAPVATQAQPVVEPTQPTLASAPAATAPAVVAKPKARGRLQAPGQLKKDDPPPVAAAGSEPAPEKKDKDKPEKRDRA